MHLVGLNIFHPHRLEGPRPHMQGQSRPLYAGGVQTSKQSLIKMQACRWRRHRARRSGKHGLVAISVLVLRRMANIRGKWQLPRPRHQIEPVSGLGQT